MSNLILTSREMQVLSLMCDGLNRAEIAKMLTVSPSTVATRTTQLFRKIGARNKEQAILYAFRHGLVKINKEAA